MSFELLKKNWTICTQRMVRFLTLLWLLKNSVQPSNVKNAARSAGKYLTFTKGSLSDRIFSQDGIKFHLDEHFVWKNADTMMEERNLPFKKSMQNSDDVPNNKRKKEIKEAT